MTLKQYTETYSQILPIRVSHDPYSYLSIKNLFLFNFFADFTARKLVLIHKNGKPSVQMLIIQTLFTFMQNPRIRSAEQIHGIKSRFYIARSFVFYFEISKALFKYFKQLICNEIKNSPSISTIAVFNLIYS